MNKTGPIYRRSPEPGEVPESTNFLGFFWIMLYFVVIAGAIFFGTKAYGSEPVLMPPFPGKTQMTTITPQGDSLKQGWVRPVPPNYKSLWQSGQNEPSKFDMKRFGTDGIPFGQKVVGLIPGIGDGAAQFKMLVVLVDFQDSPGVVPEEFFDALLFGTEKSLRSARIYYREVSYGRIDIDHGGNSPSSIGWQMAQFDAAYYTNGMYGLGSYPKNSQKLVEDVVDAINPFVDFSDYDNDGDGYVDGLLVVHSGVGAEFSGSADDIWSHKWRIWEQKKVDGVVVSEYAIMPEYWTGPGSMTIGVFCHEMGHLFGLPDLYDTDGSSAGIGRWGLMGGGSWNGVLGDNPAWMGAWARMQLGWVTIVDAPDTLSLIRLYPQMVSDTVYRAWASGFPSGQFYTVAFQQEQQGEGLVIQRIDESQPNNNHEWYPGHETSGNLKVAVIQADGEWSLEKNINRGGKSDPYTDQVTGSQRMFTPTGQPNSNWYGGERTGLSITNIAIWAGPEYAHIECNISTCACPFFGDVDEDGAISLSDVLAAKAIAFEGYIQDYLICNGINKFDVTCDGVVNIIDMVRMVSVAFRGVAVPEAFCNPCEIAE